MIKGGEKGLAQILLVIKLNFMNRQNFACNSIETKVMSLSICMSILFYPKFQPSLSSEIFLCYLDIPEYSNPGYTYTDNMA